MSQKKDSLGLSTKEYYEILSSGLKVTRSKSRKNPEEEKKDQLKEAQRKDSSAKKSKGK
jgi:hypothetical protein